MSAPSKPFLYFQGQSLLDLVARLNAVDLATARLEVRLTGTRILGSTKAKLRVVGSPAHPAGEAADTALIATDPITDINDSRVGPPVCP
jgi:hypothetical protein